MISNNYTKSILTESVWQTLNEDTRQYLREWDEVVELIESNKHLFEAELTSQQINTLFTSAETYAVGRGDMKTGLGKAGSAAADAGKAIAGGVKVGADVVRQVNNKINELGRMIQDTTPVQNIDAAFEKAKKDMYDKLGGKESKVNQIVTKLSDAAKAHPGAAKFAVGLLTAAAAIAGGPAGGAAAGFMLRMGNDLLAGEKLSTAVGKSAKTAAVGFLAGKAVDGIKDFFGGDVNAMAAAADDPEQLAQVAQKVGVEPSRINDIGAQLRADAAQARELAAQMGIEDTSNLSFTSQGGVPTQINGIEVPKELLSPEQLGNVDAAQQAADIMRGGASDAAASAASTAADTFSQFNIPVDQVQDIIDQGLTGRDLSSAIYKLGREIADGNVGIEADVRSAIERAVRFPELLNQSVTYDNTNAIYETIYVKYLAGLALTESEQKIVNEIGLADIKKGAAKAAGMVSKAAGKAGAAVAGAAKRVGTELGQTVTARKLGAMWQKAGSPTDSASVVQIMQQAGLDNDMIADISSAAKVDLGKLPAPGQQAKPDQEQPAGGEQPDQGAQAQGAGATQQPAPVQGQQSAPVQGQQPAPVQGQQPAPAQGAQPKKPGMASRIGKAIGGMAKTAAGAAAGAVKGAAQGAVAGAKAATNAQTPTQQAVAKDQAKADARTAGQNALAGATQGQQNVAAMKQAQQDVAADAKPAPNKGKPKTPKVVKTTAGGV